MTICKILSRTVVTALFAAGFFSASWAALAASAQTPRVDHYTATPFLAAWTDISQTADTFHYTSKSGYGTVTLPFDFPYDDSLISAGSEIRVCASGAISLLPGTVPSGPALDSANYPGLVCIFSSSLITGSGKTTDSDYYEVDGAAPNRVLTIQYHASHMPGAGGAGTTGNNTIMMQAKFYETSGNIEFIYRDHNRVLDSLKLPFLMGSVGLNGFSTPAFVANVYESNLTATPATDIRWTPASSSVARMAAYDGFSAGSCYPNPTNGQAAITVTLPYDAPVRIEFVDAAGAPVKMAFSKNLGAGTQTLPIDAKGLPSGTYYYRMTAGGVTLTRQMTVVK